MLFLDYFPFFSSPEMPVCCSCLVSVKEVAGLVCHVSSFAWLNRGICAAAARSLKPPTFDVFTRGGSTRVAAAAAAGAVGLGLMSASPRLNSVFCVNGWLQNDTAAAT